MAKQQHKWSDYEPRWKGLKVKRQVKSGPMAQWIVIQWMEERSTWCKKCREMIKSFNTTAAEDQAKFLNWTAGKLGVEWMMEDIKKCQKGAV